MLLTRTGYRRQSGEGASPRPAKEQTNSIPPPASGPFCCNGKLAFILPAPSPILAWSLGSTFWDRLHASSSFLPRFPDGSRTHVRPCCEPFHPTIRLKASRRKGRRVV